MKMPDAEKLLNIGIALSADSDSDHLLRIILDTAMDLTECDGGTLYILKNKELEFHIMVTLSQNIDQGGNGDEIELPSVPLSKESVCAKSALEKSIINIPDVYNDPRFDFSGPRKYDKMTGYRTTSMLVVPMSDDKDEIIGVLQLINAKDEKGNIIPFPKECEQVIRSLASQAAIRLTNLNYSHETMKLLESFIQVTSMAIDARTPYNSNHTHNMARYGKNFLKWLRKTKNPLRMTDDGEKEFIMTIWLHDIGKLLIPIDIMNKATRLGHMEHTVFQRLRIIKILNQLNFEKGEITRKEFEKNILLTESAHGIIKKVNSIEFITDELLRKIDEIHKRTFKDENGHTVPWLTEDEYEALTIRKGTLTKNERRIMEEHVVMTAKILSQMTFGRGYKNVPGWASAHHEYLDGTGYPKHIKAEGIPYQVRLLTILDIFDALTARDRPYKKPMSPERAFEVLTNMADEGCLDKELIGLFKESEAWKVGNKNEN